MTVDPERTPRQSDNQGDSQRDNQTQPPSNQSSERPDDDQADLLRWRADQLLDEMMLGGVDVSAADLDGRPATRAATDSAPDAAPDAAPTNQTGHNLPNGRAHSADSHRADDGYSPPNGTGGKRASGNGNRHTGGHNRYTQEPTAHSDRAGHDTPAPDASAPDAPARDTEWGHSDWNRVDWSRPSSSGSDHHDTHNGTHSGDYNGGYAGQSTGPSAASDSVRPDRGEAGTSPAANSPASPSAARSDARGDQDFDIFFDAYEENPRQAKEGTRDPAHRPPLDPEPDAPGSRDRDGRDDASRTDSPYARDAQVRDERERTAWERAPQTSATNRGRAADADSATDSSTDSSSYRFGGEAGDRTGDAHFDSLPADSSPADSARDEYARPDDTRPHSGRAGWADIPPRRTPETESDSLLRSKVSDADYLSRRYGYTGDHETGGNGNTAEFDADFDTDFDTEFDTDAGGRRSNRRGGEPQATSQVYYERQRVDREERMRSAERRPDQPMHGTPGSAPQNAEDDTLAGFASGTTAGRGRGFTSRPAERAPDRTSDRGVSSYSDAREDRRDDDRLNDRHTRSAGLDDLNFDSASEIRPEAEDQSWIHQAKEKWNWQDVSGVGKQVAPEASGADSLYDFELAGYDRDPRIAQELGSAGGRAGAMSVGKGKTRSTLLPRMSSTSVDALHEQMAELHEQITIMLPEGHEYRARALGLLEKANTILQNDPMRSAEVEYYLQQARGIVQRQEHANRLSGLYRERLQLYLGAWLAFSLVSLLARYVFQFEFDALLAGTFNLDYSGFVLQNAAAFAGSIFAGALGGSIGALLTLMRHSRRPHGFVDRKYGLRGLILPVFGLLAGALIYLPFGLLYSLIGLDPSLNVIAASIAALCAFAFGFNQESLYGTRE